MSAILNRLRDFELDLFQSIAKGISIASYWEESAHNMRCQLWILVINIDVDDYMSLAKMMLEFDLINIKKTNYIYTEKQLKFATDFLEIIKD